MAAKLRDPNESATEYQHPIRGSRVVAEIGRLLDVYVELKDRTLRDKVHTYLDVLRPYFKLPVWYEFFPIDRMPVASGIAKPYNEDYFRIESFSKIGVAGLGSGQFASGFASFKPESGLFSIVGYSFGTTADVRAGPTVTIETQADPADVWIRAHLLADYQVQLSAQANPAFAPHAGTTPSDASCDIELATYVEIEPLYGGVSMMHQPKEVKEVKLLPESSLPAYVAGTKETVPGNSLQRGGPMPAVYESTVQVPKNSRAHISVVCQVFTTASGHQGSSRHQFRCVGDGRASGQFTSIEVTVFT